MIELKKNEALNNIIHYKLKNVFYSLLNIIWLFLEKLKNLTHRVAPEVKISLNR